MALKKIHEVLHERVAANMLRLRGEKGLTQGALARRMEVTQAYLSLIEAGERCPSLTMVEKIAGALGVAPSSLFKESV